MVTKIGQRPRGSTHKDGLIANDVGGQEALQMPPEMPLVNDCRNWEKEKKGSLTSRTTCEQRERERVPLADRSEENVMMRASGTGGRVGGLFV